MLFRAISIFGGLERLQNTAALLGTSHDILRSAGSSLLEFPNSLAIICAGKDLTLGTGSGGAAAKKTKKA
jgi:hypothetical protein